MKRFNYIYYAILSLLGVAIFIFIDDDKLWLLAIMIYTPWLCYSHLVFYSIHKKKLRDRFQNLPSLQGEFTTFWMDTYEKRVAVLCMFNPFRVQYIPFEKIESMSVTADYVREDKKEAYVIYIVMVIAGKRYRLQLFRGSRYNYIDMENKGKEVVFRGETFIERYKNFNDAT